MSGGWAGLSWLGGLSFEWPWMLALLPLPLVAFRRRAPVTGAGSARGAGIGPDATGGTPGGPTGGAPAVAVPPALGSALARAGGRTGAGTTRWPDALAWIALVVALAQPTRPGDVVVTPASGRALALAIDVSGSMEREDFALDGEVANRLEVVRRVAGDFVAARDGDRVGLVLFGKEAFVASPPTFDLAGLGDALAGAGIGMAGRSTAIGDAIGLALSILVDDPAPEKAIVLLSDGTNNAGSVEPEAAARLADSLGVRVHAIALGSDRTAEGGFAMAPSADLDEATLEAVAELAGGRFFRARTTDDLAAVYAEIDALESAASDAPPARPAEDLRHWPLLALLAALLAGARRERAA